ncbi:MAG: FAD-dependent protein [Pseudomonadota bacterium]
MSVRITITLPVGELGRLEKAVQAAAPGATEWRVARRSLDARQRRRLQWVLSVEIRQAGQGAFAPLGRAPTFRPADRGQAPVVIVGAGPAGLFAATALAEVGIPVEIVDRGAAFPARHLHVRDLRRDGRFNPESNYRFGLGGAGTYSDGKIFTRKRGPAMREVLARLAWLGEDDDYAVDARPHIGTNRLVPLLERLRRGLEDAGVVFRFDTRVDGLVVRKGRVRGVRTRAGDLDAAAVILAPGNASRDTFEWLDAAGVAMAPRDFAVGVRVEHPRELIDRIQHGALAGHPELEAAEYRLAFQVGDRGVYTFCMCPGGHVLPVPAEPDGLAINGMSHAARGSAWSNAALVVAVGPRDWEGEDVLAGMRFQRRLERAAAAAGGRRLPRPGPGPHRLPRRRFGDGAPDLQLPTGPHRRGPRRAPPSRDPGRAPGGPAPGGSSAGVHHRGGLRHRGGDHHRLPGPDPAERRPGIGVPPGAPSLRRGGRLRGGDHVLRRGRARRRTRRSARTGRVIQPPP